MTTMQSADIFKEDKKTIDTQKVTFKMWENKNRPDIVCELADILSKFVDEKRVFHDIEFYLPQLAHLIIQLDQLSEKQSLERLAILICETSMHAALQLSFILVAALEDYQPEFSNGQKNPKCNLFLYSRCARLLQDVERAVIYGSAAQKADDLRENGEIRVEVANSLSKAKTEKIDGIMNGQLFYKRNVKKDMFHSKGWKERHFVIDRRVLSCFREPHSVEPLRSIPLQNCTVVVKEKSPKYGNTLFDVVNESNNTHFQMRAPNEALRQKWVDLLVSEINGAPAAVVKDSAEEDRDDKFDGRFLSARTPNDMVDHLSVTESELTSAQRKRFHHFKQQRIFITNLTNICERLRFQDRSLRKYFLQRDMKDLVVPPLVNIPLSSSQDTYNYVLRTLPIEGHAFSTKARVPALMFFEVQDHSRGTDVATFLGLEIEKYPESEIVVPGMEVVNSTTSDELSDVDRYAEQNQQDSESAIVEKMPSRLRDNIELDENEVVWREEGTGMQRLAQHNHNAGIPAGAVTLDAIPIDLSEDAVGGAQEVTSIIGETFEKKAERIRSKSPYGHLPGWKLDGLIAKSNDDVRQEVFVMQMISYYQIAFKAAKLDAWLYTYRILSTSKSTGLIQLIPNAISLDGLKKKEGFQGSLSQYFKATYHYKAGEPSPTYKAAINAYIRSLAGYSIVTYLLAIKDRHNGNVMLDNQGHIIHIDFGFVFGLAPGKQFSMEKAPWKLTKEMADVMGDRNSEEFKEYTRQCVQALLVARKHAKQAVAMMEIMMFNSNYPAFLYNSRAIEDFKSRLFLDLPDKDIPAQVDRLMNRSYNSLGARLYDDFQLMTNGIAP